MGISKSLVAACISALVLLASTGFAAEPNKPAQRHPMQDRQAQMAKDLGLTEQQQAQMQELRQAQMKQMQQIRQDSSLTEDQKRKQMQDARDEFRQKMNQILTPEQQKKMAGMGMGGGMGASTGPGARMGDRGDALLNQLNLTDAQKEQIKPMREKMQADLKQIRDNNSLSPEQKREQAQKVRQQSMDDMKKVLTPEQKAKLDEMQKNRPQPGPAAFRNRHPGTAADSNSK